MPADTFLWLVAQALFLGVFVAVGADFVRRPQRVTAEIALLFGAIAAILVIVDLPQLRVLPQAPWQTVAAYALLSVLPFVMLRLVDEFAPQPAVLEWGAAGIMIVLVVSPFAVAQPWPRWFAALPELAFVGLGGYASVVFLRGSRLARGVTSRRMLAVAVGSGLVGVALLFSLAELVVPAWTPGVQILVRLAALGAGVAYVLGFAPPSTLRRAWQEPELRTFLERAAQLPRLPDTASITAALEQGAADSTGAAWAVIGMWDADRHRLRYRRRDGTMFESADDELIGGISFSSRRPVFATDAARLDPAHAAIYTASGAQAVMAAPITAGEQRLGVLTVYAPRASIFADDDLRLVTLLADQAAVVLESRALIDEAAQVAAQEEATRLKDDFLSAAAHDLRTPLTTLLLHAELLKRETSRSRAAEPSAASQARIERIVGEAKRLRELVTELLDGMQAEGGQLSLHREPVDLVAVTEQVCADRSTASHPCRVDTSGGLAADGELVVEVDLGRYRQLIANLVDNAIKYSPTGGEVVVELKHDETDAHVAVIDHGIGIPAGDLARLFDRFRRGSNVDDRRFHGLGLGLYICRGIVEQHGGRISAISTVGVGTRIEVSLPLRAVRPPAPVVSEPILYGDDAPIDVSAPSGLPADA